MNNRSAWIPGIVWIVVLLVLSVFLAQSLKVVSNIGQFMPTDTLHPQLQLLQGELEHGPSSSILLISIHGGSAQQEVQLSRGLKSVISKQPGNIESIRNGETLPGLEALGSLDTYRYLLTDPDWSEHGLRQALLARLSDLRAGAGPVIGRYMLSDPYLALPHLLHNEFGSYGPGKKNGVWYEKNTGALLLVKVKGDSLDLDTMQAVVRNLKTSYAALEPAVGVTMQIAGPGVMAVASRAAIQEIIKQLSIVVLCLMVLVFWLAYRSLHLMLLAGVPLLSAMLAGLALTQLVFGEVHAIVIAFGVTLLGVCMDYPLHLFSHCRHEETAQMSMTRIWPTLRLGGISTALAFLVLAGSGFTGLSQLALFSSSGVIVALLVTQRLLPYWVRPTRIRPKYVRLRQGFTRRWQVTGVLLVLTIPLIAWLDPAPLWESGINAISPVPATARQLDGRLRKAMGVANISHLFLVQANQLETVLEKTEQLAKRLEPMIDSHVVTRIEAVTRLLPSHTTQNVRQGRIPPRDELKRRLAVAVEQTPFRLSAFSPFLDAAAQARRQQPIGPVDLHGTLFEDLVRQSLVRTDSGWLSIIRVAGVKSDAVLDSWLNARPALAAFHVQPRNAVSELLADYRKAALERVCLAFILLIFLVWMVFRRKTVFFRIILPVMLGVIASLSFPVLLGHGLTVFHLLAALLVMGMGLDYSLFFNRTQQLADEHIQSMHAIGISMLTTVTGFSVLAFSEIPVMAAMGSVIAVGILLCFLLAWLLARVSGSGQE